MKALIKNINQIWDVTISCMFSQGSRVHELLKIPFDSCLEKISDFEVCLHL